METWDALRARRKTQRYADRPIPAEELDRILEAGRRSQSSRNEQRWAFVVVTERNTLERLSKVWQGAAHIAEAAATIGIVAPHSDDPETSASINFDLGQATMSMILAATDLGIGTRHANVEDHDLGAEILGLPDGQRLTWMLGLGYPADGSLAPVENPDRRPFDEVVHRERW